MFQTKITSSSKLTNTFHANGGMYEHERTINYYYYYYHFTAFVRDYQDEPVPEKTPNRPHPHQPPITPIHVPIHHNPQYPSFNLHGGLRGCVDNVLAINAGGPGFATTQVHERNRFIDGQFSWNLSLASVKSRLVLVSAYPGNPRQSPQCCKMDVCVDVHVFQVLLCAFTVGWLTGKAFSLWQTCGTYP